MARESGLTISALRFYHGAGVLRPASVDPGTGYRYYTPDQVALARLVASLRRVGMRLAGIRQLLLSPDGPITPLVVNARSPRSVSLLMPERPQV